MFLYTVNLYFISDLMKPGSSLSTCTFLLYNSWDFGLVTLGLRNSTVKYNVSTKMPPACGELLIRNLVTVACQIMTLRICNKMEEGSMATPWLRFCERKHYLAAL